MIIFQGFKILDTKLDTNKKEPSKYWVHTVPAVGLEPFTGTFAIIAVFKPFVHNHAYLLGFCLSIIIDDNPHNSQENIKIDNYWTRNWTRKSIYIDTKNRPALKREQAKEEWKSMGIYLIDAQVFGPMMPSATKP